MSFLSHYQGQFQYCLRSHQADDTIISFKRPHSGQEVLLGGQHFQWLAGPCSLENADQARQVGHFLKAHGLNFVRAMLFKPRTSPYTFQGLQEKGLPLLQILRDEFDLLLISEVHDDYSLKILSPYVDIWQVGTRNAQNYSLLKLLGETDKPVILKRPMAGTIQEWLYAAEYILHAGNQKVILCERGVRTFEKSYRNMVDFNGLAFLKELTHLPLLLDPSHGTGVRQLVAPIAKAGATLGLQGMLIEVHPQPEQSWTDAQQAISFDEFMRIKKAVSSIQKCVSEL